MNTLSYTRFSNPFSAQLVTWTHRAGVCKPKGTEFRQPHGSLVVDRAAAATRRPIALVSQRAQNARGRGRRPNIMHQSDGGGSMLQALEGPSGVRRAAPGVAGNRARAGDKRSQSQQIANIVLIVLRKRRGARHAGHRLGLQGFKRTSSVQVAAAARRAGAWILC